MDTVTISVGIAIIGCVIGVLGWARTTSKDESELASAITAMQTSLSYIEQDIKDIKAEFRRVEADVQQANETAAVALATANAAHDRLDILGVETASKARARRSSYGGQQNGTD